MIAMPSILKRYRTLEETAMDMRQLSYFVAIVEEGTFSRRRPQGCMSLSLR